MTIERHGGAAMGSVYAELQYWVVNVATGYAELRDTGKRLIGQRARPLKVQPLIEEVIELVRSQTHDPRLKWKTADRVQIIIGKITPAIQPFNKLSKTVGNDSLGS